jgi:hypothetical protein
MRASTEAVQALSSATSALVPHTKLAQVAASRVPWHVEVLSQVGAVEYDAGQSEGVRQQSPPEQQMLLSQWPLVQSLFSSQGSPSGPFGTQTVSQCAPKSQAASLAQVAGQVGGGWFVAPVQ